MKSPLINNKNVQRLNFPNLARKYAAEAWTKPKTKKVVMNVVLAEEFAKILDREMSKPSLGCATTRQLIKELTARVGDLNYSTVFGEKVPKEEPSTPRKAKVRHERN